MSSPPGFHPQLNSAASFLALESTSFAAHTDYPKHPLVYPCTVEAQPARSAWKMAPWILQRKESNLKELFHCHILVFKHTFILQQQQKNLLRLVLVFGQQSQAFKNKKCKRTGQRNK